jgi:hypothetical protein
MKVIAFNGSARKDGNTTILLIRESFLEAEPRSLFSLSGPAVLDTLYNK